MVQVSTYINKLKDVVTPFFHKKEEVETTHACCIVVTSSEVRLLHINHSQELYEVLLAEKIQLEDDTQNFELLLATIVKRHELQKLPCNWLLCSDDYQLFLIESMPVHPDEFRDALTWRLRSLLNFPVEEAVIDHFILPGKKATPNNPMIAAVVAKQAYLQKMTEIFKRSGLNITKIDIPEIAMHNLTSLYEDDEKSTAFIYFLNNTAILNITRQKTIYFSRTIQVPADSMHIKQNIETISLDILRYFDYFQSQWRFPSPSRVFIGASHHNVDELVKIFAEFLVSTTAGFSVEKIIANKSYTDKINHDFLLPFGALIKRGK